MTKPTEAHPVHDIIHEEAESHGWSEKQFIARFCMYHPAPTQQSYFIAGFWWHASDIEGLLMDDDSANTLSRIFGTTAEFWKNYHNAFQQGMKEVSDE